MARTLIVSAAPGAASFTAAWAEASRAAAATGGEARLHDLVAMGFDPVERGAHYGIAGAFDPLKAQESLPAPPDVAPLVSLLTHAQRPLFILGGGARGVLWRELLAPLGIATMQSYAGRGTMGQGAPFLSSV